MNRMYNDDFKKEPLTEENESIDYILPVSKNKKKHKRSHAKPVPSRTLLSQAMNSYTVVSRPNRIWRIGMMRVNENILNTAESMFSRMDHAM